MDCLQTNTHWYVSATHSHTASLELRTLRFCSELMVDWPGGESSKKRKDFLFATIITVHKNIFRFHTPFLLPSFHPSLSLPSFNPSPHPVSSPTLSVCSILFLFSPNTHPHTRFYAPTLFTLVWLWWPIELFFPTSLPTLSLFLSLEEPLPAIQISLV